MVLRIIQRGNIVLRLPAAHRLPTNGLNFHQRAEGLDSSVRLHLEECQSGSVLLRLVQMLLVRLPTHTIPPPPFIYSFVFRGVCPAPHISHVDSPGRRTPPQGNGSKELFTDPLYGA